LEAEVFAVEDLATDGLAADVRAAGALLLDAAGLRAAGLRAAGLRAPLLRALEPAAADRLDAPDFLAGAALRFAVPAEAFFFAGLRKAADVFEAAAFFFAGGLRTAALRLPAVALPDLRLAFVAMSASICETTHTNIVPRVVLAAVAVRSDGARRLFLSAGIPQKTELLTRI
jgi:hypothetical protein